MTMSMRAAFLTIGLLLSSNSHSAEPVFVMRDCAWGFELRFEQGIAQITLDQKMALFKEIERVSPSRIGAFVIQGHADLSEGNQKRQQQLALQRAQNIEAYIKRLQYNFPIIVEGKAATYARFNTPASNRRAEMQIAFSRC